MCGIFALYHPHQSPNPTNVDQALDTLYHRGPDSRGTWCAPSGHTILGHTLLSITQLGGGLQPLVNQEGTHAITVNGEFYDYADTWAALEAKGYVFTTTSDSELPLHLYDEYGPNFLSQLRGEFAFVLWDDRNQQLFAARDRFGICPLYYAEHAGGVYLASEIKALFAAGVPAIWDQEAIYLQTHGTLLPGRTLFQGVRQVPPGYALFANRGGVRLEQYWDIDFAPEEASHTISQDQAIEETRALFADAVKQRIPSSAAKYGCYLSGGLDSTAVLGAVTEFAGEGIPTFTIGFDDEAFDESSVARRTAQALGAELHELRITSADLADNFEKTVFHTEGMLGNGGSVAKFLLSKTAHDAGCRAIITGEGADEIFAGYEEMGPAPADYLTDNDETRFIARNMGGAVPFWMAFASAEAEAASAPFSREMRESFAGLEPLRLLYSAMDAEAGLKGRALIDQSMYIWQKSVMANFLLRTLGDGVERAHSIEGRLPLLDHKLAEYVAGLPVGLRIQTGHSKFLLRKAARPFIPDEVYAAPKQPFLAPPMQGKALSPFMKALRERVADLLPSFGVFDRDAVLGLIDGLPGIPNQKRTLAERRIIRIASLCVLNDQFAPSGG